MKINPYMVLATVVSLGVLIWFLRTAEYSNIDMTGDYVTPIQDISGTSLSGSNLLVMDPVTGNMNLAPVDKFNTNTKLNLNKVVSVKVPGQISTAVGAIRGRPGQDKYIYSMKDLHNGIVNRYTKTESDNKFVKYNNPYYFIRYQARNGKAAYLGGKGGGVDMKEYNGHRDVDLQKFIIRESAIYPDSKPWMGHLVE